MVSPRNPVFRDRYEIKESLGRGGMGVVYRAIDRLMQREVAVKTLLEVGNPAALELFYKETGVLSAMVHPNLIGIYDIGEFEHEGVRRPFFVMPLLPGITLDKLIREGSPRLTVEAAIGIVAQASRGLHAAHEQGLIHRDVKPSNIFVLDDDSVKIIDFGIARLMSTGSRTSLKGTLYYMAPEQLQMKPPTAQSDIFSLAVVCYEALTRRRPFDGASEQEIIEAILHHSPPPVSELNPNVKYAISQVVHKGLAKQPWHRFSNAREFGDVLLKAMRGEPLDHFDVSKVHPRLERAMKSFQQGDYAFASELLSEIESEGHLEQDIGLLRRQLDQAVRQTRIKQSLESARRFFEAEEYQLALRKIQEALEMDPENADALSLKNQIEKQRRERKIGEWIELANQHLANNAFRQAREAVDNVLKLKPSETGALRLMTEIGRREQEFDKAREEKSNLYRLAMQAWEKGDITSALSKLEVLISLEGKTPDVDSARGTTYQNFFNQVRSEHDAIRNSYGEARRQLAADNFEAASAICKQYLSKYPSHALFQALQFDVEDRERQKLSAVIAETDRKVEEEPDLDRRAGILEEILRQFPGETHFERAIRLVRDKRDLVNSIVSKARFYEERGQFSEAHDQWQILRSIHERYPGLPFEIERLLKKRDQQALSEAKARWVERIDRHLESGDYARAGECLEGAFGEFPGDPELLELENVVRRHEERAGQSMELLANARELGEQSLEASLDPLRQAAKLDPANPVIRTVLANTLFEHARQQLEKDYASAEPVLEELLALDPGHSAAQSLLAQIADRKREDVVNWCLAQARRMQAVNDLDGALAILAQGLSSYPGESRLLRLQATLGRARTEPLTSAKPAQQVVPGPETVPAPPPPSPIPEPAPVLGDATGIAAGGPPRSVALTESVEPSPPPQEPALPAARPRRVPGLLVAIGSTVLVLGLLVGGAWLTRRRAQPPAAPPPPPVGVKVKVTIQVSPPGAGILLDGRPCGTGSCEPEIQPGTHHVEARLDGYFPGLASFEVSADNKAPGGPVILNLLPAVPLVTLSSDLSGAQVRLDGSPAGTLDGGDLELKDVGPGSHTLEVASDGFRAVLSFEMTSGGMPSLTGPIKTQGIQGIAVTSYGNSAKVYSSVPAATATLNGQPAGNVAADGLQLNNLPSGAQEVSVQAPGAPVMKVAFVAVPRPALLMCLMSNRDVGSLRLTVNEDEVDLYLNGERNKRKITRGQMLLYLAPKRYVVRVQKPGFATPPEQTVEVKYGRDLKADFKLAPEPKFAALNIRNSAPGAEVLIDGWPAGTVGPDGVFSAHNLQPGPHTITIRKEQYQARTVERSLSAGASEEINGGLERALGSLRIDVTPAGLHAQLTVRREGDTTLREATDRNLQLPDGPYVVTASAPGYQTASVTARVTAGQAVSASLVLRPEVRGAAKPAAAASVVTIGVWEQAGGWTRQGNMLVHRGGDFVLAPAPPASGVYELTVTVLKGRRLELVANYRDNRNYVHYDLDGKDLERAVYRNGKKQSVFNSPAAFDRKDPVSIRLTVTKDSITHSMLLNGQWNLADRYDEPGAGLDQGRFGFKIPGRDELGLSDFRFSPK